MARNLMDLPAELRLMIYSYTFADLPRRYAGSLDRKNAGLQVLQVCLKVREEATPLLLARILAVLEDAKEEFRIFRRQERENDARYLTLGPLWAPPMLGERVDRLLALYVELSDLKVLLTTALLE